MADNETTSDMAFLAANNAIENAKISKFDIDLIVLATTTPDNTFPSTASLVQKKLEINAVSFDIQAVCAGFVFALSVAKSMMIEGMYKNCLVIGADAMSKLIDWKDRSTSVLFGDGAGAIILQKYDNSKKRYNDWGILSSVINSDGQFYDLLKTNGGVSSNQNTGFIEMEGKEIFKHAIDKLSTSLEDALKASNKKIDELDWLVPHQANQRIILAVADKLKIDANKVISTVKYHGNTSAASIPLALENAITSNKISNGNLIGLHAIGGGLSWGASIIRIGKPKIL